MPTLEATTTTTVQIKPALLKKLRQELRTFAELRTQLKALEHAVEKHKNLIADIREETGEQSITIDGFSVTLVAPIRKVFDAKKFVALGGNLETYNKANIDTPSKAYCKVSVPKEDGE
jgi:hypothetical protein